MKTFIFFIFTLTLLSASNCNINKNVENKAERMEKYPENVFEGKIIKINFTDKGGRVHNEVFDYFFEIKGDRFFIKMYECKVSKKEIVENIGKNIKVKGYKTFGLWDTNDPTVQSRVGDYIVINEIIK